MLNNMDEEENFASAEQTTDDHVKWTREHNSSEPTDQNEDTCCVVEPNKSGPALSDVKGSNTVKKSSCRAAVVILGLLSLLLLTGLIILLLQHTKDSSKWEMKLLQICSNNLTEEKHQLQTSYNNLTEEKHQLQTSYNNLTEEKHQLQSSYNNLTEEKHQLQTSYNNLTEEKHQLQSSYNNLTEEKHQLQSSYNNLTEELKQLKDVTTELHRKLQALHSHEWKYFAGSLYYISSTEKSWQESRNDCLQKGADLVIINNHEEQEFTRRWKKLAWIGLTDAETEGKWTWVDGTLLGTPRYWSASEPNNVNGNEDCAEINFNVEKGWNDLLCDVKRSWICESRL